MTSNKDWKFYAAVAERQPLIIDGFNIWDFVWETEYERLEVIEPQYGETKVMIKYWIKTRKSTLSFLSGEFSNLIYGFYLLEEDLIRQKKLKRKRLKIGNLFRKLF